MANKDFEPLGEGYISTLVDNAYYRGFGGTIADAVIAAAGCGGAPDGPDLIRAACKLTRDSMGFMEHCLSTVDQDYLRQQRDWSRIDEFWGNCETVGTYEGWPPEQEAVEAVWIHKQLKLATKNALTSYAQHCTADWCADIARAASGFAAAALLVAEAFDIKEAS